MVKIGEHNYIDDETIAYVAYGSNKCYDRFELYIMGTDKCREDNKYKNILKFYDGCGYKVMPKQWCRCTVPYAMYYAKKSSTWNNQGVAFLDTVRSADNHTMCRVYFIKAKQFVDIWRQEGWGWYSNPMYLGTIAGYPAHTITSKESRHEQTENSPSNEYIAAINEGDAECSQLFESQLTEWNLIAEHDVKKRKIEMCTGRAFLEMYNKYKEENYLIAKHTDCPDLYCTNMKKEILNIEITLTQDDEKCIDCLLNHKKVPKETNKVYRLDVGIKNNLVNRIRDKIDKTKHYKDDNLALVVRDTSRLDWDWQLSGIYGDLSQVSALKYFNRGIWLINNDKNMLFELQNDYSFRKVQ